MFAGSQIGDDDVANEVDCRGWCGAALWLVAHGMILDSRSLVFYRPTSQNR
jgi:hypothetical protein